MAKTRYRKIEKETHTWYRIPEIDETIYAYLKSPPYKLEIKKKDHANNCYYRILYQEMNKDLIKRILKRRLKPYVN